MKNIKASVDDDIKAAFRAAAVRQGTSESRLLLLIINTFLNNNPTANNTTSATETKNDRFSFRVSAKLKKDLSHRAKQQGMSPSAYLVAMVRAHLSQKAFFTEHELDVLHQTNNELTAIGRNINQIAKALNQSLNNADRANAKEFDGIYKFVMKVRDEISDLERANLRAWGIYHGKEKF